MNAFYEVDLRRRFDGLNVDCIFSGNYDDAYNIADNYNRNLPDYNDEFAFEDYNDGISSGLYASIWTCYSEFESNYRGGD